MISQGAAGGLHKPILVNRWVPPLKWVPPLPSNPEFYW